MRESLLTIPIGEAFEPKCGCPICNMRNTIEEHILEYIMGAAMMEPDVRIETNALGFCHHHFNGLLRQNNRLSLALMLDTRLNTLREEIFEKKGVFFTKNAKAKKASEIEQTCFVCDKVDWGVAHMLDTVYTMFRDEEEFRKLYAEQEYVCVPHYNMLLNNAPSVLKKGELKAFSEATDALIEKYIKSLNDDVHAFCLSYDYRNAGKLRAGDEENVRASLERAIEFLTSRKPDVN